MAVLPTTVPYSLRRHLGAARPVLGALLTILYLASPIRGGGWILAASIFYSAYSVVLLFNESFERIRHDASTLLLDFALLTLALLHPSQAGLWLAFAFYFYLLALSALLYGWRTVVAIVAGASGFFALQRPVSEYRLWAPALLAGLFAVTIAIQKRHLQNLLASALRRSVIARSEIETARESERQRIAGDFHDGPLQSFISFQMRLEIVRKMLNRDTEAALGELIQLQDLGRAQLTELRTFVRHMQPAEVKPTNLQGAISETIEHFERDSGVTATLICGDLTLVGEDLATEVVQLIREGLNNVRKHSRAARVSVVVDFSSEGVAIAIEDDGSGFVFSGSYSLDELDILRLGPKSIKRRVRTLGGDLVLQSRPTEGATLKIHIPG